MKTIEVDVAEIRWVVHVEPCEGLICDTASEALALAREFALSEPATPYMVSVFYRTVIAESTVIESGYCKFVEHQTKQNTETK